MFISKIVSIVYIVVGVIMANNYGYLTNITNFGDLSHLLSAILAIILWPLLLVGVHLQIPAFK